MSCQSNCQQSAAGGGTTAPLEHHSLDRPRQPSACEPMTITKLLDFAEREVGVRFSQHLPAVGRTFLDWVRHFPSRHFLAATWR
jgi:hypothetical protein